MPKRSDNRQVGAGSGQAAYASEVYVTRGRERSASAAVLRRPPGHGPLATCAMDRPSGSPPPSPTSATPAQSGFGAFCSALSETISVRTTIVATAAVTTTATAARLHIIRNSALYDLDTVQNSFWRRYSASVPINSPQSVINRMSRRCYSEAHVALEVDEWVLRNNSQTSTSTVNLQ